MITINKPAYGWRSSPIKRSRTDTIVLHHAAVKTASAMDVHNAHLQNDNGTWIGIGYNFYIRKDGIIYEGRPENAIGAHAYGWNSRSIGICFEGNFEEESMGDAQIKAGQALIAYLKEKYPTIQTIKGHKDFDKTLCPGKNFPFDAILATDPIEKLITSVAKKLKLDSSPYWDAVLRGKKVASAQNVKALFDKIDKAI